MAKDFFEVKRLDDGGYLVSVNGMVERFNDESELRRYATIIKAQCESRAVGKWYVKDEYDGKISVVHTKSRQALRLNSPAQGIAYADWITSRLNQLKN